MATAAAQKRKPVNTLAEIPIQRIVVCKNNPRKQFDSQALDRLAHAIATRGFDHPIVVKAADGDGKHELISGERRWRAAKKAGVDVLPALVKATASSPAEDMLDAMLANDLNVSLDVLEEALGFQAMLDSGHYTRNGITDAFKVPQARVRERLLILELPQDVREQLADGTVPLMVVKTLASLCAIHEQLPALAVKRVLDGPAQSWDDPLDWDDLVKDPIATVVGAYDGQVADLPEDVFVSGCSYPASTFELQGNTPSTLRELCDLLQLDPESFSVRFDRELVEQAVALKAAHYSANRYQAIIVGRDVASQLASDYVEKCLEVQRQNTRLTGEGSELMVPQGGGAGERRLDATQPSPEELEADKQRAREENRRVREQAIASNQRLGTGLLKTLTKVKIDARVLKILTAAPVANELGKIATRGARLSFPAWAQLTTRKNGSTKAEYLHPAKAEAKAREFLSAATSASEIAGRTLALLAAARWSVEENAIAQSSASHYELRLASSYSDHGVPWRNEAEDLLDEILIERLPADVSASIKEAKAQREAARAEELRRERERDGVIAGFIERAPSLSRDERQAEIQRLRREYGYSGLDFQRGHELMELPEPSQESVTDSDS